MTVTQTSAEQHTSDEIRCSHCASPLPAYAVFCGACGQRVDSAGQNERVPHTPAIAENNGERYRITALVGRHAHVQLFFATDTLFKRPVTIRDVTVSTFNEELQEQARTATQHEYDLLRRQRIPGLTPVIDVRASNGHILVVCGWPFPLPEAGEGNTAARTHTLEDLLQSGIGLPNELVALTWIHTLCSVVSQLHHSSIIIGTLDPESIVISTPSYTGQPALMVSWLPQAVRSLLLQTSSFTDTSHFSAPEVLHGQPLTQRSDLYSLGALLYLLLTGVAPEEQTSWIRTPAQKLRERTQRVSKGTEELVLRAISPDPSERFQNADEMSEALQQQITSIASKKRGRSAKGYHATIGEREAVQGHVEQGSGETGETIEATISVVPIRAQLARWHISLQETKDMTHDVQHIIAQHSPVSSQTVQEAQPADTLEIQETSRTNTGENERIELAQEEQPTKNEADKENKIEAEDVSPEVTSVSHPELATPEPVHQAFEGEPPFVEDMIQDTPSRSVEETRPPSLRARITGLIPAFPKKTPTRVPATQADLDASTQKTFLSQLQQLFVGEQRQRTTAAALIETPLRVQPNQSYTIRIHLMGRDAPFTPRNAKKGTQPVGLSSLKKDEVVHIEVRSAIYQNYAYIVQRADVHIPGEGFAAEVTIPMQPLSGGQNGRRERMHIFFMDELRQPLYEKPFVLEVFVSHLVQTGREGHNVLTIPV